MRTKHIYTVDGNKLSDDDIFCARMQLSDFIFEGQEAALVGGLLGKNRRLSVGHEAVSWWTWRFITMQSRQLD